MPGWMERWLIDKIRAQAANGIIHPVISAWGGHHVTVRKRGDMEFQADTFGSACWKVLDQTMYIIRYTR